MKLLKISLALLLVFSMLLTFAACKEEEESKTSETESTASETSEASEESTPAESEPEESEPETAPLQGTWEFDEDITKLLKTGQAHNSEYATIINSIDITFYQTHRFTFDGTTMTMQSYVKDAMLDELLDKVSEYNLSYEDLELERYDSRSDAYPTPYSVEDGKIKIEGGYIKYTCTKGELQLMGMFTDSGEEIDSGDSPFLYATFKRISATVDTSIPEYNK